MNSVATVTSQEVDLKLDIANCRLVGTTKLTVQLDPKQAADSTIDLHSFGLNIISVKVDGSFTEWALIGPGADEVPASVAEATYATESEMVDAIGNAAYLQYERIVHRETAPELRISIPEALKSKLEQATEPLSMPVIIAYEVVHPVAGVRFRDGYMCSDSQVRRASAWVPCADIPLALVDFRLSLTVRASEIAAACGTLEKQTWADPKKEWKTLHYTVPLACAPADIVFAAGQFHVDSGPEQTNATAESTLMTFFTPKNRGVKSPLAEPSTNEHSSFDQAVTATSQFLSLAFRFLESELLGQKFPLPTLQQVFLPPELLRFPVKTSLGIQLLSTDLLINPKSVEQSQSARCALIRALSSQWFGHVCRPASLDDDWLLLGLIGWCEEQYIKRYMGKNELIYHRYTQRKAVCTADNGDAPPLAFRNAPALSSWGPMYGTERMDPAPLRQYKATAVIGMLERRAAEDLFKKHVESIVTNAVKLASSEPAKPCLVDAFEFINELARGGDFKKEAAAFRERWVYGRGVPQISAGYIYHRRGSYLEMAIRQVGSDAAKTAADRAEFAATNEGVGAGVIKIFVRESMGPADHPVHIGGESHVLTELKVNPEIKKIPGKRGRRRKDETEEMIRAKQEALLQNQCPVQFVRIDPGWEWLCGTKMHQQDRMWLNQLKNSKDIVAQLEAVQGLSEVRISIQQHSTLRALKEVLEDKDMFYQVRVAAAYALAGLKGDGDEPVGQPILIEYFKQRYQTSISDLENTFHFSEISEYFVAAAVVSAVSMCRQRDGSTGVDVLMFTVPLAENYNSIWAFDDSSMVAALCTALGNIRTEDEDDLHEFLDVLIRYLFKESAAMSPNCIVGEACLSAMLNIASLPDCSDNVKERVYSKIKQCCDDHNLQLKIAAQQALLKFVYMRWGIDAAIRKAVDISNAHLGIACIKQAVWDEVAALAGLAGKTTGRITKETLMFLTWQLNDSTDCYIRHLLFCTIRRLQEEPPTLYRPPADEHDFAIAGTAAASAGATGKPTALPVIRLPVARAAKSGSQLPAMSAGAPVTIFSDGATGAVDGAAMEVDQGGAFSPTVATGVASPSAAALKPAVKIKISVGGAGATTAAPQVEAFSPPVPETLPATEGQREASAQPVAAPVSAEAAAPADNDGQEGGAPVKKIKLKLGASCSDNMADEFNLDRLEAAALDDEAKVNKLICVVDHYYGLSDKAKLINTTQTQQYKERTIILIDAHASMLEPCELPGREFEDLTWMGAALKAVGALLRARVISGASDDTAIVFYGSERDNSRNNIKDTYVLQELQPPDVNSIQQIENFTDDQFVQEVGSGSDLQYDRARALANGLWQAKVLLKDDKDKTIKSVFIMTRDESPATTIEAPLSTHAEALASLGAWVQLFPLVPPSSLSEFKIEFWSGLLQLATPASEKEEDSEGAEGEVIEYDEQRILAVKDLMSFVRRKAYKKRALTRMTWSIGPRLEISIKLYSLFSSAWPKAKGSKEQVDASTFKVLKRSSNTVDMATGENLGPKPVSKLYFPFFSGASESQMHERFPKVYLTAAERNKLQAPMAKGLRQLGFKPRSLLADWHSMHASQFIYPDEGTISGSTVAFTALLEVMEQEEKFAVAALVRTPKSEPRLVALLPQLEEVDEYGQQVQGGGMHIIYLPYLDDVRNPEEDVHFTGDTRQTPSHDQVDAAVELVDALTLAEYDIGVIPNAQLQRHYAALESLAMHEKVSDVIVDASLPDEDAFHQANRLINDFKDLVFGVGYTGEAAGKKRKATEIDRSELAAEVEALNIPEHIQNDTLKTLTNDKLKMYLEFHNLGKTGKKDDLVERIKLHWQRSNPDVLK